MKYKTLRFLSLLFLAVIVSVGARAAADSHNPYTAEAKRYDKQPSEKVMEAAKKLADAGDSQKAIILYTLVCRRFRADMPEKEKQTCILAHVEVSKLYITSASYIKALDLSVEGVKLNEECEKQPHVAKLYNLIGNAYTYFLDYEKGMNYYKKALAFCRKYPDRETEYKILCNMTNLCVQQHNLKEANRYYKMSERVRDRKNDLATYMSSYTQGRIEMGRGIYAKQIARYRHLADYAEKHKLPAKFTCYAFEQMYLCFREMHQNDSVVKYLHVCYETAKRKDVLFHFTGAIRSLANHYDEVGDIAKANDYKTQYIAIEDSSKNTREFDMMKNKLFLHEVEQTTKEIDTLHEKEQAGKRTIRQQQAVIAGITLVCLCVCIFFFVIYRQKRKPNAWSGFCSADEGRKDVATSYYQHFTDCYYTFHGVRFLGMFNYFNREEIEWVPCTERGGIDEKGNMTKPIKVKIAFYNDNGPEGLPGDLIYSKVFDVIGEQTGVETMDGNIYAFNVDLGEDIKMEHGFMQINAIDENDESINCYLSLFKASTSPGYALVKMDSRDGSEPAWGTQMSCCYCLDGDGSFISEKAVKFTRILSPTASEASQYGKVQVELFNIGSDAIDNVTLQLWQEDKLIATEKVNATIPSLESYKYTFNARVNCSEIGNHHITIKNVTPNSDMIAADTIVNNVVRGDGTSYPESAPIYGGTFIKHVKIGDIDCESGEESYADRTNLKTDIMPGQPLTLEVEPNEAEVHLRAWVDWNNDDVFDNSEAYIFDKENKATISVPENADIMPGEKRMRIVLSYETPMPEGNYYYGETEDYTLVTKNADDSPAVTLSGKSINMETKQDSKATAIELTNQGAGTLTADVDFNYILPYAPTANYSTNKVAPAQANQMKVIRKAAAKTSANPAKDDATQYVLRYDNGQYDIIGITNADTAIYANYFPGEMLASLKGMKLSSVDVYVSTPSKKNSIVIFGQKDQNNNGDLLVEQPFQPVKDSWNHVVLDQPITIGDQDLWIGYQATGMIAGTYCIGVDHGNGLCGFGDRTYIGQDIWWSMVDLGMNYNYCLRANVTGERTPAISWLSVADRHIDVPNGKTGKVNVSVDASKLDNGLYEAKIEIRTNDALRSVINIPVYVVNGQGTGIISKEYTGGATVRVSGNTLAVSADKNIDRIQVFDLSGRLTQTLSVNGRSYNATLTGLSGSLYIMKISYADGTSSTIKVPVI